MKHQNDMIKDDLAEDEIDLLELLMVLLKKWKYICLSAIWVGGIVLLVNLFILVPQYSSTAKMYVLSSSTSILSVADVQLGSSLTSDYILIAQSRTVADQVIEELQLDLTTDELIEKVDIENPTDSHVLNFTVTDDSPEEAKRIVDKYIDVSAEFIGEKMDQAQPTVWEYGIADDQPIAPSKLKNSILGVLMGAILAMIIVAVLHLMDDTIQSTDDIEKYLGLATLASIPDNRDAEKHEQKMKKDEEKSRRVKKTTMKSRERRSK
jgi:capsular polysaccharide biosynthesis protein